MKSMLLSLVCKTLLFYYTTDGSEPTKNSNVYKEPLKLTQNTHLKAKVFGKEGESDFNQEFFF